MDDEPTFVDYYRVLGVAPDCDSRTLELAYRHLAKRYHPDHPGTADVEKFNQVIAAFRGLKSPEVRAKYDLQYAEITGFVFTFSDDEEEAIGEALSDAAAHEKILTLLYRRRREFAKEAGLGHYIVQQELRCSDDAFDFFVWYLKEKGFIELTEQGTLAITIAGVDHVISTSKAVAREKLRITQEHGSSQPMSA